MNPYYVWGIQLKSIITIDSVLATIMLCTTLCNIHSTVTAELVELIFLASFPHLWLQATELPEIQTLMNSRGGAKGDLK